MNYIDLWQLLDVNLSVLMAMPWANWGELGYLGIKFGLNILMTFCVVRLIYQPAAKSSEYAFTYFTFNILIFFLCHLMLSVKLGIGFAFGLFALFSIMRYRTDTIGIKDMTYLFAVVCIAVINALSNDSMSYAELGLINGTIVLALYILERTYFANAMESYLIQYDNIKLIQPQHKERLLADLTKRTGKKIEKFDIISINYLNDSVQMNIHFREDAPMDKKHSDVNGNGLSTMSISELLEKAGG